MGAKKPVGRPPWVPGGPSEGRLGRQEARREAVLGGRLGRQKAGREAVWAARSPEPSVLPTVASKMQVLGRLQAGRRLQAGGRRLAKLQTRKA